MTPSNEMVVAFLHKVIPQITALQKASFIKAKDIFHAIFDTYWANYHNSRWKGRRKRGGGVAAWICNNDSKQNTRLLNYLLNTKLEHPELAISEFTLLIAADMEVTDIEELQAIERSHRYLTLDNFAWELVALHKFCLYCLNNSKSALQVGKKVMEITDWNWAAYFMTFSDNEQVAFCEMIMQYK